MRIIRTGPDRYRRIEKGWVREGILGGLSKAPMTLTEISRELGVSKSTTSYHLAQLLDRGVVEIVDARRGRGSVLMKSYGLRAGSLVMFPSAKEEEAELGRLRETFEIESLRWRSTQEDLDLSALQSLLYKIFLHLFRITRSEHRSLMLEYGQRTGAMIAPRLSTGPLRETIANLSAYLRSGRIADVSVFEVPDSAISVMDMTSCIGSGLHGGNSCYFLEGIVRGAVSAMQGSGVRIGRVRDADQSSCFLAIGRVRNLDTEWVSEALLSSPLHRDLNRRRP